MTKLPLVTQEYQRLLQVMAQYRDVMSIWETRLAQMDDPWSDAASRLREWITEHRVKMDGVERELKLWRTLHEELTPSEFLPPPKTGGDRF